MALHAGALIEPDGAIPPLTGIGHYMDSLLDAFFRRPEGRAALAAFLPSGSAATLEMVALQGAALSSWARGGAAKGRIHIGSRWMARPASKGEGFLDHAARIAGNRLCLAQTRRACRRYDLLHVCAPSFLPLERFAPKRTVVTIYDLTTVLHPWAHEPSVIRSWEGLFAFASNHASRVLAISEATKRDVVAHLGIAEDRIDVTPLAPRAATRFVPDGPERDALLASALPGLALGTPFVLYAGTLEPRKNLERLLHAFADLVRQEPALLKDYRLALAGGAWPGQEERLRQLSIDLHIAPQVVLTGYVSSEQMNALMSACAAFAYVSLYEGFGMPPLEAMVCGAPVIASNVSSLPEVVGDAGISVDPEDTGAIAGALHRLLSDAAENRRRRALSLQRAEAFSWERTAEQTLKAYQKALAGG